MMWFYHTNSVAKIEIVSYKRLTFDSDRCGLCGEQLFWWPYPCWPLMWRPIVDAQTHKDATTIGKTAGTTATMVEHRAPVHLVFHLIGHHRSRLLPFNPTVQCRGVGCAQLSQKIFMCASKMRKTWPKTILRHCCPIHTSNTKCSWIWKMGPIRLHV